MAESVLLGWTSGTIRITLVQISGFVIDLCAGTLRATDKTLGKIFIKAASSDVNGQQFPDAALEDTVKDMKKGIGQLGLAADESEADFLLLVLERKVEKTPLGQSSVV